MAVYSTRFIGVQGLLGAADFTCPAGYRAVMREIDAAIGVEVGAFLLQVAGAAGAVIYVANGAASDGESFQWKGRYVFNEGEAIAAIVSGAAMDVSISGYLLTLP